tara:strand:- start:5049 stop:5351 length:303 start_codon:yes stop_codon:yes gene_type:complete
MVFGNKLRDLRESKGLFLRQVAAALEVDTATMSKIERGDRQAKKEQLQTLANLLDIDFKELYTLWLANKVCEIVIGEDNAIAALKVAENEIIYGIKNKAT